MSVELKKEIIKDDRYCKYVLRNKYILAYLIQEFLEDYRKMNLDDIVPLIEFENESDMIEGLNTEDLNDHKVIFDILFTVKLPHSEQRIGMYINVEAQNMTKSKAYYENRAYYYISRLISRQGIHIKNSKYQNLVKVVSLWLCFDGPSIHENHMERLRMKKEAYNVKTKEFKEKNDEQVNRFYEIIMVYLKYKEDSKFNHIMELLFYKDGKERFKELESYGIKYALKEVEEATKMVCVLGEEYIQRGRAEGLSQGIALGIDQTMVEVVKVVKEKLNCTSLQALEFLNVQESQQAHIIELVEKEEK